MASCSFNSAREALAEFLAVISFDLAWANSAVSVSIRAPNLESSFSAASRSATNSSLEGLLDEPPRKTAPVRTSPCLVMTWESVVCALKKVLAAAKSSTMTTCDSSFRIPSGALTTSDATFDPGTRFAPVASERKSTSAMMISTRPPSVRFRCSSADSPESMSSATSASANEPRAAAIACS